MFFFILVFWSSECEWESKKVQWKNKTISECRLINENGSTTQCGHVVCSFKSLLDRNSIRFKSTINSWKSTWYLHTPFNSHEYHEDNEQTNSMNDHKKNIKFNQIYDSTHRHKRILQYYIHSLCNIYYTINAVTVNGKCLWIYVFFYNHFELLEINTSSRG